MPGTPWKIGLQFPPYYGMIHKNLITIEEVMLKSYIGDKAFYRRALTIAVPIFMQNIITNFVSLLDNLMVGQLGTLPMSGVAVVNQLLFVFTLVSFGTCTGTGIFTAQYYGQGNTESIRYTLRFKILTSILFSGLFITIFLLWDDVLIRLFLTGEGSSSDAAGILAYGKEYLKVMLWGLLPFAVSTAYATTLRECGETLVPMISSFAAMFCNLILNYILIFGHWGAPVMGVAGAAVATVISRFFELAIVAVWAHSHKIKFPFIQGLYRSLRIPGKLMGQMITKVAPLILNEALWSTAITFQNQCYSTCGLAVVSALNIVTTLNNMATVAASAIGNTVGILMGQMLGAGRPKEEVRSDNQKLMLLAFVIGGVFGVLMACSAVFFPNLYNTSQAIRDLAAGMILITAATKSFQSYHMSVFFTIRSGGLAFWTLLYDCGYLWLLVVPLTFAVCHFSGLPFLVIYGISLLPELLKCVFGGCLLRKAPWIRNLTLH